eukprot:c17864_g1_i1 orf=382-1497(-)
MPPPCVWHHNLPLSYTSGVWAGVVVAGVGIFFTWMHRSIRPAPSKICGSPSGPPVTAPRVKLKDGRHIAYKELGVPRNLAHYKVIYVHGFNGSRHQAPELSKAFLDELSIYIVSFDRAGYGESDPNPSRDVKSEAQDIEQLADLLELGNTFYLLTESIGGYAAWSCLKYIPQRLAGVGMIVPVVNYWWKCISKELFKEAFGTQILRDRWFMQVVRHFPWLIYFYITQPWIPKPTPMVLNFRVLNAMDKEVLANIGRTITPEKLAQFTQGVQQGVGECLCRDLMTMFGDWEFDPCEVENPFVDRPGQVHIWQGEEDYLVPKELHHVIHRNLPWINYHEIKGGGHLLKCVPGFTESALRSLFLGDNFDFELIP